MNRPAVICVRVDRQLRAPGIEMLREGDTVGFDVGWTSKGLCITSIKPASRSNAGD